MKNGKILTIHMPIDLYKRLEAAARNDDRSVSSLVRHILARHVPGENKRKVKNEAV
jgi:predicted DNA-binding protein